MQLQLENSEQALFWSLTWTGNILVEKSGIIGTAGVEETHTYVDKSAAFDAWLDAGKAKMEGGYQDPKGQLKPEQLEVAVYERFIEQQELESADAWLAYFGGLEDPKWEDQIIAQYMNQKKYVDAEKHIFRKLQKGLNPNIIIRQIRYLATINPALCRFMLGNLPNEIVTEDPVAYYKELGMAHSKIGFFDILTSQIKAITAPEHQLIYLLNLLDTPHDQHPQQLVALEKAREILQDSALSFEIQIKYYQQFLKGANQVGAATTAAELQMILQQLEKQLLPKESDKEG